MHYTVNKLAQLSGVTVRTLRFYDEIGLLKPAYVAESGYRYYQDKQLLLLQQILFFRELGFELKNIQKILTQSDFDMSETLRVHKKVLRKDIVRMTQLVKTIDKTINHLAGNKKMNEKDIFSGFDRKEQERHQEYLIGRFGDKVKVHIDESNKNVKGWKMQDWESSAKEFNVICKELTVLLMAQKTIDSPEVQAIIQRHYDWLKKFWTPNKESYVGLGQVYNSPEWVKVFESHHSQLAHYMAQAMSVFAEKNLF